MIFASIFPAFYIGHRCAPRLEPQWHPAPVIHPPQCNQKNRKKITGFSRRNGEKKRIKQDFITKMTGWLVVDLPLWKILLPQLGWWHSQYMESHKIHVPNHQADLDFITKNDDFTGRKRIFLATFWMLIQSSKNWDLSNTMVVFHEGY